MSLLSPSEDQHEADAIKRFVELTRDLCEPNLTRVALDSIPQRDRTYVWRLRILMREDPLLLLRQRIVWAKLRHEIPLLEVEARELIEVLGCRGFYDVSLSLKGMVLTNLNLNGAVIGGDYDCRFVRIQGECDETSLVVGGDACIAARTVEGPLRSPFARDASGGAEVEHTGQLLLHGFSDAVSDDARLAQLAAHALPPPRIPRHISLERLLEDSTMIELSDEDVVVEQEPPPSRPRSRVASRPPVRIPRVAARSLRPTARPPDLGQALASGPRDLPTILEASISSRAGGDDGAPSKGLADRSSREPAWRPSTAHSPENTPQERSRAADTREIDAAW